MLEALKARVNGDEALVRRGRYLTTTFLLEVGEAAWLISIFEGRVVSVTPGPFVMPSSSFALRAPEEEWQKFWSSRPPPGSQRPDGADQAARPEGRRQSSDLHGQPSLLQGGAGETAPGGSVKRMSAQFEPIIGRYMQLDLFGRRHRIYVEEAGEGTPLLCLHTAGADGRQYRALMNDGASLPATASSPSTCPGTASRRRLRAGTTRSTSSPRRNTPP